MEINFPSPSEKKKILDISRNQNYFIYLGRKFGYLHPKIYDIVFETYRNFRMLKYFGFKDYFFGSTKGIIDFLIVGFPKSGTTSLDKYLLQHPKLFSSWYKEPHFFSYGYNKGIDYYLKNFRFHKNSINFDNSNDYISFPDAFKRIKQFNPNMKFIVCLRNPVDQVYSSYNDLRQSGQELDTFEDTLSKEDFRKKLHLKRLEKNIYNNQKLPIDIPHLYLAEYVTHIKRALDVFDYDNFFFVDSIDLMNDTQQTMNKIFNFLGIDSIPITVTMYNKRKYEKKISSKTREKLLQHFQPYNQELEKLLKRNFNWN